MERHRGVSEMWVLEGMAPDGANRWTFRLTSGAIKTVGRASRADFVVDAPLVSRLHCRLTAEVDGTLLVEDLGSTNGTFVNGERVASRGIRHGDRIGVGRVELVARLAGAAAPAD